MKITKKIALFGLLLSGQAFCGTCDFQIKKASMLSTQKKYQIKISFKEACSKDSFYKRELVKPKFELYQKGRLISSMDFEKGLWLESSQRFHFMGKEASSPQCDKLKNLTLDLKDDYITSLSGNYLNLKVEEAPRWKCAR